MNITRDDVEITISFSVWLIFFFAWLIIFSSDDIKFQYRTRIVSLYYGTMLKFRLIFIEFRNKMSLRVSPQKKLFIELHQFGCLKAEFFSVQALEVFSLS